MAWTKSHPVNFTVGGDLTSEAIEKHINELTAIYTLLNRLRTTDRGPTAPTDPEANAFWIDTAGSSDILRYYNGSSWVNLLEVGSIDGLQAELDALQTNIDGKANVDSKTDGYIWVRKDSSVAAQYITQQGSGAIIRFLRGAGDGTLVSQINNDGTFSGSSAKLGGSSPSEDPLGSTIVKRTSEGYIKANYIHYSGGATTVTPSHVFVKLVSDNYIFPQTLAMFKTNFLGSEALIVPSSTGDYIEANSSAEVSTNNTTYTKVKEILIGRDGNITTYFSLKMTGTGGNWVTGRVYVNGAAVGTERIAPSSLYVNFTEDLTGLSKGDLVQVYAKTQTITSFANVKTFMVKTGNPIVTIDNT